MVECEWVFEGRRAYRFELSDKSDGLSDAVLEHGRVDALGCWQRHCYGRVMQEGGNERRVKTRDNKQIRSREGEAGSKLNYLSRDTTFNFLFHGRTRLITSTRRIHHQTDARNTPNVNSFHGRCHSQTLKINAAL